MTVDSRELSRPHTHGVFFLAAKRHHGDLTWLSHDPVRRADPAQQFGRLTTTGSPAPGSHSLPLAFRGKRVTNFLLTTSRRGGIGRRAGLKIQFTQVSVGSIPSVGSAKLQIEACAITSHRQKMARSGERPIRKNGMICANEIRDSADRSSPGRSLRLLWWLSNARIFR
jgi:hypothetical protein